MGIETEKAREYFERASPNYDGPTDFVDIKKSRQYDGIYEFKRKVLGYFGKKKSMTIDELANKLVDLKMADDSWTGRHIVHCITGCQLNYGKSKFIKIDRVSENGHSKYEISCGKFY